MEIRKARELNPLSIAVNDCAAFVFNCANRQDEALEACHAMLRIDQDYFPAYQHLAAVYLQKSMFKDAISALQKALDMSNGASTVKALLGFSYALSGQKEKARNVLAELKAESRRNYVSPVAVALVHAGLGQKDQAILRLEEAYQEHSGGLLTLKVLPVWSSLRSEPRFAQLLSKIGLA